jgi:tetratricopeptide (TPR) repeat protein
MADGVLTLSKTTFAFGPCLVNRGFRMQHCDFRVSPGKILELENQPEQSSRIHVKVAIKNAKGDKEDKKDYYFYNVGAREVGDGAVGGPGTSIICDGCDDSMDVLYGLLTRIRQPGEAASVGKASPDYDATVQKGMDAYSKSLTPNPNDTAAHNNYVLALAKAKKYPEMEAEMRKAAELDPATAYSKFYNLGALLSMNGQGEAAAKAFKMAIDAAPDNPRNVEAYYQYGLSLAGQATVDKDGKFVFPLGTLEAFQKYLDLAPTGRNARVCKDMITQLGGVK